MRHTFATAVASTLLASAVLAGPAWGQFEQYTEPGTLSTASSGVDRTALEEAVEAARWHLGPVRLDPWLGLRDLAWVDNPAGVTSDTGGETVDSDLTASVGAGLRAYLPTGPKVTLVAHALPEYVWWRELDQREWLAGRYGVGAFGFFNRLEVELTARRSEQQQIATAELPDRINVHEDRVAAAAELLLSPAFVLFAEGSSTELEHLVEEDERDFAGPFGRLDRDETTVRAGVRFAPRSTWSIGLGLEQTDTEYLEGPGLSSTGEAVLTELAYRRGKVEVLLDVAYRQIEDDGGERLVDFEDPTGSFSVGLDGNRLDLGVYARRSLTLSITEGYAYFVGDLVGVVGTVELGHRTSLSLYGEAGTNDYVPRTADLPGREQDYEALGGELSIELHRSMRLVAGATRSSFGSLDGGDDREITTLRIGLTFGTGRGPWV